MDNNTKKCRHCKSEIDKKANVCPNCRKSQQNPAVKIILIIIGIILLIGGCSSLFSNAVDEAEKQMKENFSHTVEKSYLGEYNIGYYIEGTVTNNSDKEYSYLQIDFICYDKAGNNLGTAMDNTNNVLGKQTWKYKAYALFTNEESVDHCDFKEITGW